MADYGVVIRLQNICEGGNSLPTLNRLPKSTAFLHVPEIILEMAYNPSSLPNNSIFLCSHFLQPFFVNFLLTADHQRFFLTKHHGGLYQNFLSWCNSMLQGGVNPSLQEWATKPLIQRKKIIWRLVPRGQVFVTWYWILELGGLYL